MATTSEDTIMEEREELMVPSIFAKDHQPTRRLARFLKPSVTSDHDQPFVPNPPTVASVPQICSSKVCFNGWRTPQRDWKPWVDRMHSFHQSTWKQAGIHDAVLNSKYEIMKNDDLLIEIARKWCDETKSFLFVCGEVTITLEDMMVLGGYSVLGESVLNPVENSESRRILSKLNEAMVVLTTRGCKKADQGLWLNKFKGSGSEIEHEAFLVLWLSRFVFPSTCTTIVGYVFTIAVHLARGIRIALAPAVLARLYADLRFLKDKLVDSIHFNNGGHKNVIVWAPFQLVQVWIWERSPKLLQSVSNVCKPTFARWDMNNVCVNVDDVSSLLDCAIESFCWQPYARKIYQENGRWVVVGDGSDEELESWVRCLRVSELVGICGRRIEQYLPHRVAMQFGLDQDVPGDVPRSNASPETAWRFYTRPISDARVYLPSKFSEPYVTARYLEWWMQARRSANKDEQDESRIEESVGGTGASDDAANKDEQDESRIEESVGGTGASDDDTHNVASDEIDELVKLGPELEARIRKLEEVFAHLKAAKDGHR